MNDQEYQKYFFIDTYLQYPSLNYNEIMLNLVKKYEIKKILYSKSQFSKFKYDYNQKYIYNKNIKERLNDIKLYGKNLLICNMNYIDFNTNKNKNFRIFATQKSISLLKDTNIKQYFIDTTYRCIPHELDDSKSLLVMIGYNSAKDLFELILVGLLSNEDTNIFKDFYNFIINNYDWNPQLLTFDFGKANLKAIKEIFKNNKEIKIIPCLFHLLQCWWRKASLLGLRKKKYIQNTKLMMFNLELIPFMNLKTAREFYGKLADNIPKLENYEKFLDYFEETWFPKNDSDKPYYEFELWNYSDKFDFKGNKNQLIKAGELEKYVLFSNNAVESFNHLINQCLDSNSRVSASKFEEVLKYIFIRFTSNNENEKNIKYTEKTLISDLLRELVELGVGKNGKIINMSDYKKIKTEFNENIAFSLTFNNNDIIDESDEDESN